VPAVAGDENQLALAAEGEGLDEFHAATDAALAKIAEAALGEVPNPGGQGPQQACAVHYISARTVCHFRGFHRWFSPLRDGPGGSGILSKPCEAQRNVLPGDFEFAPGDLICSGGEWEVLSYGPEAGERLSGLEGKHVADAKTAERNVDAQQDRKMGDHRPPGMRFHGLGWGRFESQR
jgi:hypothetical protein